MLDLGNMGLRELLAIFAYPKIFSASWAFSWFCCYCCKCRCL